MNDQQRNIQQKRESLADRRREVKRLTEERGIIDQLIKLQLEQIAHILSILDVIDPDQSRLSECCGAGPENDQGICPSCKEHCEFLTGAELESDDQ
jgi:hypothetical protein